MTQIVLDSNLARKLESVSTPSELCAPDGRIVGMFTPAIKKRIDIPFTEEEIEASKREKGGRPLADILADLEKR